MFNEFIDATHFEACDGLIDVLFTAYMIIRFYSSIVNGLLWEMLKDLYMDGYSDNLAYFCYFEMLQYDSLNILVFISKKYVLSNLACSFRQQ